MSVKTEFLKVLNIYTHKRGVTKCRLKKKSMKSSGYVNFFDEK